MNQIENWYDTQYDEWSRLDRHRVEFEITKKYLDRYIKGKNLRIFDIGGGPGRYSFYLAEKGHHVTLLDLSQHNIDVAREKSKELRIELDDYIKGNALALPEFSEKFDVILLMGPLYHLINEDDRKKALQNAASLLKEGGIIVASFISNYAPIQDCLSYLQFGEQSPDELLNYLKNGENQDDKGFTVAYFSGIEETQNLMRASGFRQLAFAGVENILGCKEREILALPEDEIQKWLEIGYALSQDSSLLGTSQHFLYIGQNSFKKVWI